MRAELEDLLLDRYAPIFRGLHKRVWDGVSGSFFECGDGWFHIIDCLCGEILHYVTDATKQPVLAMHVKEKFGTLRFRYRGGDAFVEGLVRMAEGISEHVCEVCAAPGERSTQGAISTLCHTHGASPECVPQQDADRTIASFHLPMLPRNPGWQHLARAFEETADFNIRHNNLPPFIVDAVIETEALTLRRVGDGVRDSVEGMLRMIEVFSLRCDRRTSEKISVFVKEPACRTEHRAPSHRGGFRT